MGCLHNTVTWYKIRYAMLDSKRMQHPCHSFIKGPIDRMHKWQPKNFSFVYVLIRLTSLVCMDKIQKKCFLKTRLVSLIST